MKLATATFCIGIATCISTSPSFAAGEREPGFSDPFDRSQGCAWNGQTFSLEARFCMAKNVVMECHAKQDPYPFAFWAMTVYRAPVAPKKGATAVPPSDDQIAASNCAGPALP